MKERTRRLIFKVLVKFLLEHDRMPFEFDKLHEERLVPGGLLKQYHCTDVASSVSLKYAKKLKMR